MIHRWSLFFVAVTVLSLGETALARPWQGVTAGKSTKAEVLKIFGPPHRIIAQGGACVTLLNYQKEKKIRGTIQANFCLNAKGVVNQISVFPDSSITRELVEEAYGPNYKKKITDQFREYYLYKKEGMAVFWDKEGKIVESILFTPAP